MLSVHPQSCLQDEETCIKVSGLGPFQAVTISSHIKDFRNKDYFAYAHYNADKTGNLNNYKQNAVGGLFTGLFPMGLIAALKPAPHEYEFLRFFKRDVENPNQIEFRLYDGFLEPKEIFDNGRKPLSKEFHFRHYMGAGVKKITVNVGQVRGSIFLPPGKGPYPGVIDLFGTAGGLLEYRASMFASRGIAALALAYFDYEDLPQYMEFLDLNYFKEAAQILLSQELVRKPSIGAVGVSKGADLALCMATFIPEVSLAISINGLCANAFWPLKINENKFMPGLSYDISRIQALPNGVLNIKEVNGNALDYPETIIPLHETRSSIMFIVGEDDGCLDSKQCAKDTISRMKHAGKVNFKLCSYKNAGHLIEPPYSAFCQDSYHKLFDSPIRWGGELKAHTESQVDSWKQMIAFIKDNLKNQILSKL